MLFKLFPICFAVLCNTVMDVFYLHFFGADKLVLYYRFPEIEILVLKSIMKYQSKLDLLNTI